MLLVSLIFFLVYYFQGANSGRKIIFFVHKSSEFLTPFERLVHQNVRSEVNPCENFFDYACGNQPEKVNINVQHEDFAIVTSQILKEGYITDNVVFFKIHMQILVAQTTATSQDCL